MRVSLIVTVRNEAASIDALLASLQGQTRPPDEIIITDGGSSDGTVGILLDYTQRGLPLRVIQAPGANISQGRNLAIAAATGDIIACTDAGVRLATAWLEELTRPFISGEATPVVNVPRRATRRKEADLRGESSSNSTAALAIRNLPDVVSGFFLPDPHNLFETVMGATVLPQLDDIQPASFLPSSRSVAFTKTAWQRAGGYPEWLDYCEDLVFDLALRQAGCRFAFAPKAIAYFRPRSSLRAFFVQYYRYARGDGKADLWRKRHTIRYITYILAPLAFALGLRYNILLLVLITAAFAYCWRPYKRLWPHLSRYSPAERLYALLLVPVIRLTGDLAKMLGYPVGMWWRLRHKQR